ncbi:MAG: tRNA (adenosine(37)-N6)-threonylcarbamoyltransferase complex ATPase subunit type 1 TsaE [Elusimicrobiota bacterium]
MSAKLKTLNIFSSYSAIETEKYARKFAGLLKPGDLILLEGEIGSGKTTFLNAVFKELGSNENVISSSFSLVYEYKGRDYKLVHFDLYRTGGRFNYDEFIEYFGEENIIAIEWPYNVKKYLKFFPYLITIKLLKGDAREIKILKYG